MFEWISGKKDTGHLALTDETRQRLSILAQAVGNINPEAVLEKLLTGELGLVSPTATEQIQVTPEGFSINTTPAPVEAARAPEPESPPDLTTPQPAAAPSELQPSQTSGDPVQAPDRDGAAQQELESLRQQIDMLQTRLNQRRDQQAAQQAKISTLLRQIHQQEQDIEAFKTQVEGLRQAAAIGEAQLNRWRFNNFSR